LRRLIVREISPPGEMSRNTFTHNRERKSIHTAPVLTQ
jgi:hypothetical protein